MFLVLFIILLQYVHFWLLKSNLRIVFGDGCGQIIDYSNYIYYEKIISLHFALIFLFVIGNIITITFRNNIVLALVYISGFFSTIGFFASIVFHWNFYKEIVECDIFVLNPIKVIYLVLILIIALFLIKINFSQYRRN